jgi:hypothetical protein
LGLALGALLAAACSGRGHPQDAPEPIPECQTYQQLAMSCFGREASADMPAITSPASPEERERLRALCVTNTQRLEAACR